MRIAFFDSDMLGKGSTQLPNLELMKLATYYKQLDARNRLEMLTSCEKYQDYDIFYYFKNTDKSISVKHSPIFSSPNVICEGLGFHNGQWLPLADEIERCEPDVSIYNEILRYRILKNNIFYERLEFYKNSYFLRIFYNDWEYDYTRGYGKKIQLYDYDITTNLRWKEVLKQIRVEGGRKLYSAVPIPIYNIEDMRYIVDNELFGKHYAPAKFYLDFPELHLNFSSLYAENERYFKDFIRNSLYFYINKFYKEESEIDNIVRTYDISMYCVAQGVRLYPIYYKSIEQTNYYRKFCEVISYFFHYQPCTSFFEYADRKMEKAYAENIFQQIKKEYPLFYPKLGINQDDVRRGRIGWEYTYDK